MSTPKQDKPRILVNYGSGSEVLDLMILADLEAAPVEFAWWSKNDVATGRIQERLPKAPILKSQMRHLATLLQSFPLRELFPEKCSDAKIQAAAKNFPDEWLAHALRWDEARAAQQGRPLDKLYILAATLHLAEAVRVLSLIQPDLVLLRGGSLASDAAFGIVAAAHSIPVLYTERGAFPESLFLAPVFIGPEMLTDTDEPTGKDDQDEAENADTFIAQYMEHDRSAWTQPPREDTEALRRRWGIPADYRIIFYAAQRPADANMLLNSPHFSSNAAFINHVIAALKGVEKTALIIKPHPKESPTSDREIHHAVAAAKAAGMSAICDREINIKDAIELSSVVVSINSTTGLEALLHGVPVVAGGEAYYSHRGYTFDVKSSDDPAEIERLRAFLQQPEFAPSQQADFRRFIRRLNARHQFFMHPAPGQNGPEDYLRTITQAATDGRKKSRDSGVTPHIPYDVICRADALIQEYSVLQTALTPPRTLALHLKHQLMLKWHTRRRN